MNERSFNKIPETNLGKKKQEQFLEFKVATIEDLQDYKNIRIEAVKTNPDAFDLNEEEVLKESMRSDKEWKKDILDRKQFIVLMKYNSDTKGMAKGVDRENGFWSLRSVYTTQDFRQSATGQPTSEEMIQKVLDEIKNRGGKGVMLGVLAKSEGAISLYQKFGFRKLSESEARRFLKDPTSQKWHIMILDLTKEK